MLIGGVTGLREGCKVASSIVHSMLSMRVEVFLLLMTIDQSTIYQLSSYQTSPNEQTTVSMINGQANLENFQSLFELSNLKVYDVCCYHILLFYCLLFGLS